MRRKDRLITGRETLLDILSKARVVRIGFAENNTPYIVPLNFGFTWNDNLIFYFHSAREGKKIDMLKKNPEVCFELDEALHIVESEVACRWGMKYRSLMGTGRLSIVTDNFEIKTGLDLLLTRYGHHSKIFYSPEELARVHVLKLSVSELTGKSNL